LDVPIAVTQFTKTAIWAGESIKGERRADYQVFNRSLSAARRMMILY
jgi:hypothetical protein